MVLETFFAGVSIAAFIFIIIGIKAKVGFGTSFLIWGGIIFALLGFMILDTGIDREINWRPERNPADQNRIYDINSSTTTFIGTMTTDPPPAGVVFDQGLWIIAQIYMFIFGAAPIMFGLYITIRLLVTGRFWSEE